MSGISEYWPIYLALCAVPGIIAHKKGRSFIGFSALSLIISPLIATIISLLANPGEKEKPEQKTGDNAGFSEGNTERSIKKPSMQTCPKCGFKLSEDSVFCNRCGIRIIPEVDETVMVKTNSIILHGDAEPLAQFLSCNRNSLKVGDVIGLLLPVAAWLGSKHRQGDVFLRLYPGCLRVTQNGCIVIENSDVPSDNFVAPEQILSRYSMIRADIFEFCAVLRYALNQISDDDIGKLSDVMAKGLNEDPNERFNSMQELIYALLPFNTGIPQMRREADAVSNAAPMAAEPVPAPSAEHERKHREIHFGKKHTAIIAGCAALILLLGSVAYYFLTLDKDSSNKIVSLETGREHVSENDFSEIEKMISDGKYASALIMLEKMHEPEAEELKQRVYYEWADYLAAQGEYSDAYNKIKMAKGYSDAAKKEETYKSSAYLAAIDYYHEGEYKLARNAFRNIDDNIGDYKKSASYELLLAARIGNISKYQVEQLMDDISFEDTREVLICNQAVAELFLNGTWKGDGKYLTMKNGGEISYDIPWFYFGDYYEIKDGFVILYKETQDSYTNDSSSENEKKMWKLTVVDKDCITVHSYKNNKDYTLHRK